MQLELKRIQHEMGLTFVHVTHDQEEAMTMADTIAVMNDGRIEQLGRPGELYERPRTSFVAGFLGISNLLVGSVVGADGVRLDAGDVVRADRDALGTRRGPVAIGVRPEKIRLGAPADGENTLAGTVRETAYVGVSTHYVVETGAGLMTVYVQNTQPGARPAPPGSFVMLSWSPDATFVVDRPEEEIT
jgi:spermidine/putrescine transport system ATP-binding protein